MRVSDLISYSEPPLSPDPDRVDLQTVRDTFVMTAEAGEICARLVQRLARYPTPQPSAFLFTGSYGVGKTHLLRYLGSLLTAPEDPAWRSLERYLGGNPKPARPLKFLSLPVPDDPAADLGQCLVEMLLDRVDAFGRATQKVPTLEEFAREAVGIADHLASRSLGLLAIEDISRRIDRLSGGPQLDHELLLYKVLAEAFSRSGILVLFVAEEKHLRHDSAQDKGLPPVLERLSSSCDFIWISRNNIAEIISGFIAVKDDTQKTAIRKLLDDLQEKLPLFGPKAETFIDLYPIHPHVFSALFQVRAALPKLSPLGFSQSAIDAVRGRPALDLIRIDSLFDYILPDLRKHDGQQQLLQSYDLFCANVIPELKPAVREKATSLLKGIALWTICGTQAASVKSLANALLFYDESSLLPSYSMTSALLIEMEQKGEPYLLAQGERFDRSYRLLRQVPRPAVVDLRNRLEQEEGHCLRLPLLIYDWLRTEIPSWIANTSPQYLRSSQTLVVPLPEGEPHSMGMVYFKSTSDPPWSEEDQAALRDSPYPWILLVLSPLERFYEFDSHIRALARNSPRIMVWRPDAPNADEMERLRRLSASYSGSDEKRSEMGQEVQQILSALYVGRGWLITAAGQWLIGEDIQAQSVAQYLSRCLTVQASFNDPSGEAFSETAVTQAPTDGETQALRWAALLSGREAVQSSDPASRLTPAVHDVRPGAGGGTHPQGKRHKRDPSMRGSRDKTGKHTQTPAGHPPIEAGNHLADAHGQVLAWWESAVGFDSGPTRAGLHSLSEALLTTRLWNSVGAVERYLDLLEPTFELLRAGETSLVEAMERVLDCFNQDEQRLLSWRNLLESTKGLLRWLPAYEHTREYVQAAFLTGQAKLDAIRETLLQAVDQPHLFLDPAAREAFDRDFLEFKQGYIDFYHSMHGEALEIIGDTEKTLAKVESKALRNLEMLSTLHYTDRSYLNRVRVFGKWAQQNQCHLPVRQILERFPHCYCNFNPSGNQHLARAATRVNSLISEGIEYFRAILRKCSKFIIEDLKTLRVDDFNSKQVAAVLSHGPMIPLRKQAVDILNQIIDKHSSEFLAEIRAYKP